MNKTVLALEVPGVKALPGSSILKIGGSGAEVLAVASVEAALSALGSLPSVEILLSNAALPEFFACGRQRFPAAYNILVTDSPMEQYSKLLGGAEDTLVDHVIASRSPQLWTINEIRVTLQKLLQRDIFGVGKYLSPGTVIKTLTVTGSKDREPYNSLVMNYAEEYRLGQYTAKLIFGITEELLMNAIYDAPVAGGREGYAELPRTAPLVLEERDYSELSYACDGQMFAIAVADPFGALTRERLFHYLKKVLRRTDSANLIDTKKGGAGLGLFKILYSSHALVCNIEPGRRTEVIALLDVQSQVRDFSKMARSVHYFSTALKDGLGVA